MRHTVIRYAFCVIIAFHALLAHGMPLPNGPAHRSRCASTRLGAAEHRTGIAMDRAHAAEDHRAHPRS